MKPGLTWVRVFRCALFRLRFARCSGRAGRAGTHNLTLPGTPSYICHVKPPLLAVLAAIIYHHLAKVVLIAFFVLILHGVLNAGVFATILLSIALLRLFTIGAEAIRKPAAPRGF